jgi:osmotically-inducible protein OsmY
MVENGWVSLQGEVDWEYQRRAAETAVRDLMGVTGVSNLIKIIPKVKSADIEKRLHDALSRQAEREAGRIEVTVSGSEVFLKGQVHSWAELDAVQGAAWAAPGVTSVINELMIVDD